MILYDNKIISLGVGDVCVGETWSGLTFQGIKPPQEVGMHLFRDQEGLEFIDTMVELPILDIQSISEFECKMRRVESGEADFIMYNDWVIKFNGNEKSAKVVRMHFDCLKNRIMNCIAC